MEIETEMETETLNTNPPPASSAAERFGIKSTIYQFRRRLRVSARREDTSTLAVSLSSNAIKLYSPVTGQYFGECTGHRGTIHEISFSIPSSPNVICSCSSDATVRAWDTRTCKQVSSLKAGSYPEIFSFSFGGSSGNLLAAGCNAQILFWDWRNGKQVACLEESHMDDVTQVSFVPDQQNKFLSSSVDGLLCLFDTNGQIDDDNHMESVMNVGTSIAKVGFFGEMNQKLWCLTHIETLRTQYIDWSKLTFPNFYNIWDWKDTRREVNFENARALASDKWNLDDVPEISAVWMIKNKRKWWFTSLRCFKKSFNGKILPDPSSVQPRHTMKVDEVEIDYFADCYYSGDGDRLWVIGGTGSGTLGYFPIDYNSSATIGSPEAILEGGHAGVVRTALPVSSINGTVAQNKGYFGWTGGEDGRLCCWLSDESSQSNWSWITSALVEKSPRGRGKNRHHPY